MSHTVEDPAPDPELTELATALGSLAPAQARLDRDRLMFEAGRQAARNAGPRWAWPALAATLAAAALGEAVFLTQRPEPRTIERVVVRYVPVPVSAPPVETIASVPPSVPASVPVYRPWSAPAGGSAYEALRWQVLRFGIDALPEPPPLALQRSPHPAPEPSARQLQSEFLDSGESS